MKINKLWWAEKLKFRTGNFFLYCCVDMADVPGPSSAPYFSPRKSTENFSRLCQLIMTICSDLFRTILSHHIKPENLRMELDSKINKKRLLKRGILSVTQRNLLYPEPSQSTYIVSAHMDLSLLYTLLRNICPTIPQHQKGWGKTPNGNDNSLSACIERIRIQRNEISGHSTRGEIDDITFKDIWWKLRSDIVIIEKMITGGNMFERGIDELLICELNPSRAQKYVETFRNVQCKFVKKNSYKCTCNVKLWTFLQLIYTLVSAELIAKQGNFCIILFIRFHF